MAIKALQNFFKTTIATACSSAVGNIYITTLPTPTTGWLVINPKDTSKREIIEFNAIGTDGGGNYVYANARGVGGTTAQIHEVNEPVRMNLTAEYWAETLKLDATDNKFDANTKKIKNIVNPVASQDACTKNYADNLAIAGAPDASDTVKGITKLSIAPVSPTNPIAIGDNDTRIPTQDENDALVGTSGTPSSTNKYVTNDDTSGTGTIYRNFLGDIFGDGSDGALVYDGSTTILGMAPSSSIYTLTRDIFGTGITINNGVTIITGGFRIFSKETFTNNGTISWNANNGGVGQIGQNSTDGLTGSTGGTAGAALTSGSLYGSAAGVVGGAGSGNSSTSAKDGIAGAAETNTTEGAGVAGGIGGVGSQTYYQTAGAAGVAGTSTLTKTSVRSVSKLLFDWLGQFKARSGSGSAGAGGAGNNGSGGGVMASGGGGGGSASNGGTILISAFTLINNTGKLISSNAGAGGAGGAGSSAAGGNSGGGGGGGGGNGGLIVLVYRTYTANGSVTVTAGAGGAGGAAGGSGATAGTAGTTGNAGAIYQIAI